MRCEMSVLPNADGSAVFEAGNTKVLAAVYGPREAPMRSDALHDRALVRCEFSMASFSTGERRRRTKGDRKSVELSLVIKQALEAAVLTELMPRSQLDVNIQVLQADGGVRSAAINAAVLALADAGVPLRDTMAACSAGYLDGTPLLDAREEGGGGRRCTSPRSQTSRRWFSSRWTISAPWTSSNSPISSRSRDVRWWRGWLRDAMLKRTRAPPPPERTKRCDVSRKSTPTPRVPSRGL